MQYTLVLVKKVASLVSRSLFLLVSGGRLKPRPWERDLIWRYVVRGALYLQSYLRVFAETGKE